MLTWREDWGREVGGEERERAYLKFTENPEEKNDV